MSEVTTGVMMRQFKFDNEIIPDPDPMMHPNEVVSYLTENGYPQMLNTTVKYDKEKDNLVIFQITHKGSSLG